MGKTVTDVGCQTEASRRELKKHAATIHCSNTLTLLQRKITNALLYHAYQELLTKEEHEITVKQLCRLISYHGNNHAAIREAFRGLISTVIEWNIINDVTGAENWTASSILASVSLEGPLCFYAYSPRMKQLLHSPSMFGKIDLVIQSKFRSSYGLALYENCIRYRGLPHTKWFDMDLFKKLMGVPSGMYEVFRDFKRRVLDKAVEEVNTYSDLVIEPEYIKEGRKVIRVRFTLKERAKKSRLGQQERMILLEGSVESITQAKLIQTFHFTALQAEQLMRDYDDNDIQAKMTLVESSKPFKEQKIQNLSAYLCSALRYNYQLPQMKAEKLVKKNNLELMFDDVSHLEKHLEKIHREYGKYRERVIEIIINELNNEEKQQFMDRFLEHAEDTIQVILKLQRKKYNRENILESPQVKAIMRKFALKELPQIHLMSLDEFVLTLEDKQKMGWQQMKSLNPEHILLSYKEMDRR